MTDEKLKTDPSNPMRCSLEEFMNWRWDSLPDADRKGITEDELQHEFQSIARMQYFKVRHDALHRIVVTQRIEIDVMREMLNRAAPGITDEKITELVMERIAKRVGNG